MNRYISDLHLCHANVIKFDNRPFSSLEEMHNTIISNWNSVVEKNDTTYILGDFCWGKEDDWINFLETLNGKKVLIKGNHDLKSPSPKVRKYFLDIKDMKTIKDNGRKILMAHTPQPMFPCAYNENCYMLYGHVHNTREERFTRDLRARLRNSCGEPGYNRGQFYNVGCMMPWINYTPRTLDEIIAEDAKYGVIFQGLK